MKINKLCLLSVSYLFLAINLLAQHDTSAGTENQLQKLIDGNKRFADSKTEHINQSAERRTELANRLLS